MATTRSTNNSRILIAASNSSDQDKAAAQYIYGGTGSKALSNAQLTTLIQDNINSGATAPYNGLHLDFANGSYFGMNLVLAGRAQYNNPGKIKITGNGGTYFSSSSTLNVPVFTLSNAMQIDMDNIRFKLNGSNLAIKATTAPAYRQPIISFTNTAGVLSAPTIVDSGAGITGTIVADIVDTAGTGTGAVLSLTVAGGIVTAVSFTNGGTNYSTNTKIYYRNGFTNATGTARRAVWNSSFSNIYVEGIGTHTGYAFDFGSTFRSTFSNIEIFNTNKGIRFEAQQSNFNPGNITFSRLFFDAGLLSSTTNTIGLHIASNGAIAGQGRMNIMDFSETDFYSVNGGEAIVIDGANLDGAQDVTFNVMNPEQFDTHLRVDVGNNIVINQFSYNIQRPTSTKPLIYFGRHAHHNVIENMNLPLYYGGTATTVRLISDNNTSLTAVNTINRVNTQSSQTNITLSILNESSVVGTTQFNSFNPKIVNGTTKLVDDSLTSAWMSSALIPSKLKTPYPDYATNAAAIADTNLLIGKQYTVTTGGNKALFIK